MFVPEQVSLPSGVTCRYVVYRYRRASRDRYTYFAGQIKRCVPTTGGLVEKLTVYYDNIILCCDIVAYTLQVRVIYIYNIIRQHFFFFLVNKLIAIFPSPRPSWYYIRTLRTHIIIIIYYISVRARRVPFSHISIDCRTRLVVHTEAPPEIIHREGTAQTSRPTI